MVLGLVAHPLRARSTLGDPFLQSKVQINFSNLERQGGEVARLAKAHGDSQVPKGAKLVGLMDTECMRRGAGRALSKEFVQNREAHLPVQAYTLELDQSRPLQELVEQANADQCVIGVAESLRLQTRGEFTNDPLSPVQEHLSAIQAEQSYEFFWGSSFKAIQDVIIAVIDTGVDYNHPDLMAQMWRSSAGKYGKDFVNNDDDPMDDNVDGHGTHVAGLAAAVSSNNRGVSGIFGFHAKIMAIKALGADGEGDLAEVLNGIQFAKDNGAKVINMSIGGEGENAALQSALASVVASGVVVVTAAGNADTELTSSYMEIPISYARDIDGMVGVGSYDTATKDRSSFSNFSTSYVEIAAPGSSENSSEGILSTFPDNRYAYMGGTSMSSPIVAGAAALIISYALTHGLPSGPAVVEQILKDAAYKSPLLANDFLSGNQLNLLGLSHHFQNTQIFDGNPGLESQ